MHSIRSVLSVCFAGLAGRPGQGSLARRLVPGPVCEMRIAPVRRDPHQECLVAQFDRIDCRSRLPARTIAISERGDYPTASPVARTEPNIAGVRLICDPDGTVFTAIKDEASPAIPARQSFHQTIARRESCRCRSFRHSAPTASLMC